jgi:hypothetical protein
MPTVKVGVAHLMWTALLDTSSVRSLLQPNVFFECNRMIQNCGYRLVTYVEAVRVTSDSSFENSGGSM